MQFSRLLRTYRQGKLPGAMQCGNLLTQLLMNYHKYFFYYPFHISIMTVRGSDSLLIMGILYHRANQAAPSPKESAI